MENFQFLAVKPLSMKSTRSMTHDAIMLRVHRHNYREVQAEWGARSDGSIDPRRMHLNQRIKGHDTAHESAAYALELLKSALPLRKNAAIGFEVVVSLPPTLTLDQDGFFSDALVWAETYFPLQLISAVIHHDESVPHLHVVFLAMKNGKVGASAILGDRMAMTAMHRSFNEQVGQKHGLQLKQHRRLSAQQRHQGAAAIVERLTGNPDLLKEPEVRSALVKLIDADPATLIRVLGLNLPAKLPKQKSSTAIFIQKVKPDRNEPKGKNPIGDLRQTSHSLTWQHTNKSYALLGLSNTACPALLSMPAHHTEALREQGSDSTEAAVELP